MSLLDTLERAARNKFPLDDGTVEVLPSPAGSCDAIVALTAHSFVAANVAETWVYERLPREDFTGPMRADFVAGLGEELGVKPGSIDVLLAASGAGGNHGLIQIDDGDSRTDRARQYRDDVRSYVDPEGAGVLNLGRGVDGRWDLSIELRASHRSAGRGRALIEGARRLISQDEYLFASIAPGNARCLRAALTAGFTPIGAEVLFLTRPGQGLR